MFPTCSRQAIAKNVLQSLQKFKHIRPRQKRPNRSHANSPAIARDFETIYHDLGVLTYSGLHSLQIERVGDILEAIKRNGGPGEIAARLLFQAGGSEMGQSMQRETVNFDNADCDVSGPSDAQAPALRPRAGAMLKQHREFAMAGAWSYIDKRLKDKEPRAVLQLSETGSVVDLPGLPRDIIHANVDGSRVTDCEYYCAPRIDKNKIVMTGHWFGNKERRYLGSTVTSYSAWRPGAYTHDKIPLRLRTALSSVTDPATEQDSGVPATERERGGRQAHLERAPVDVVAVAHQILRDLWGLEDETWAKDVGLERKARKDAKRQRKADRNNRKAPQASTAASKVEPVGSDTSSGSMQ